MMIMNLSSLLSSLPDIYVYPVMKSQLCPITALQHLHEHGKMLAIFYSHSKNSSQRFASFIC